jgi:hypothetical protein
MHLGNAILSYLLYFNIDSIIYLKYSSPSSLSYSDSGSKSSFIISPANRTSPSNPYPIFLTAPFAYSLLIIFYSQFLRYGRTMRKGQYTSSTLSCPTDLGSSCVWRKLTKYSICSIICAT